MPILESIQASEKKAEKYREDAKKKVEVLLEKTNLENISIEEKILTEAKNEVLSIQEKTAFELKSLEEEVIKNQESLNKLDLEKANSRIDKAIDYIIEKVISS